MSDSLYAMCFAVQKAVRKIKWICIAVMFLFDCICNICVSYHNTVVGAFLRVDTVTHSDLLGK